MATTMATGARERSRKRPKAEAEHTAAPDEEEVRVLAYQLYERRCADGVDGDPLSDWIEAERRLRHE